MSEAIRNEQETIERMLLWNDIEDTFRMHAFIAGFQLSPEPQLDSTKEPTMIVLEALPDDEYTIQLWGEIGKERMIGRAVLIFLDKQGVEKYNYNITESGIKQYSAEPTPLDKEDLEELRADLADACWDEEASKNCARKQSFWA